MGSKSTKQTTNSTQNAITSQTSNPIAPSWETNSLQDFNSRIGAFGNTDASQLVAPETGLQRQAAAGASGLGSVWQPQFSAANSTITGVLNSPTPQAQSASLLDNLSAYLNPYTDNVVNSTLRDFDQNAGVTRANQAAQAAGNNAFGGSRYAIREAQTEDALSRARSTTESGLRSAAFNAATALSDQDAGRRQATSIANAGFQNDALARQLQVAGMLGSLGSQADALSNNDINQQAAQGATERGIDGSYRTADLSQLQAIGQLLGQNQFGLLNGTQSNGTSSGTSSGTTTQTTNPGLLASIGQGAQTAASLAALFA